MRIVRWERKPPLLACFLVTLIPGLSCLQFKHFPMTSGRSDIRQIPPEQVVRPTGRPDLDMRTAGVQRDPARALHDLLQEEPAKRTEEASMETERLRSREKLNTALRKSSGNKKNVETVKLSRPLKQKSPSKVPNVSRQQRRKTKTKSQITSRTSARRIPSQKPTKKEEKVPENKIKENSRTQTRRRNIKKENRGSQPTSIRKTLARIPVEDNKKKVLIAMKDMDKDDINRDSHSGQDSQKSVAKFISDERKRILGRVKPENSFSQNENNFKMRSKNILRKTVTESSNKSEKKVKTAKAARNKNNSERRDRTKIPVRNISKIKKINDESLKEGNKKVNNLSEINNKGILDKIVSSSKENSFQEKELLVKNTTNSKNAKPTFKTQDQKKMNLSNNVNHKARRMNISPNKLPNKLETAIDESLRTDNNNGGKVLEKHMVRKPLLEHNARLNMKFRIKFPAKTNNVQETIQEDKTINKNEKLSQTMETTTSPAQLYKTIPSVYLNKTEVNNTNENIPTFDLEKALAHAELTWAQDPFRKINNDLGRPLFNIDFSKNPGNNIISPHHQKSELPGQLLPVPSQAITSRRTIPNMKENEVMASTINSPHPVRSLSSNKEEVISIESLTWTPALLQENFDIKKLKKVDTRPKNIFAHFSS